MGNKQTIGEKNYSENVSDIKTSKTIEVTEEQTKSLSTVEYGSPQIDQRGSSFYIEMGSGKGWPADVKVIHYHKPKGLLIAGTDHGTIFVFGDGCQFLKSSFVENFDEVTFILSIDEDKILVIYGDHSMKVFSLPNLQHLRSLESNWISKSMGEITAVFFDESTERDYVYIGTAVGNLLVLEVAPVFRICNYSISVTDAGISGEMAISSICLSPKDERYIALGYDGPFADVGAIIIFDLLKHKTVRFYATAAVTSLVWNHSGDFLFAGTRSGDVVSLLPDKQSICTLWNAARESTASSSSTASASTTGGHQQLHHPVMIHHLLWMPPQTANSTVGCLFIQLVTFGKQIEALNHIIIGLAVTSHTAEAKQVLSIKPLETVDILSFQLVPAIDTTSATSNTELESSISESIPALLLLTQTNTRTTTSSSVSVLKSQSQTDSLGWRQRRQLMSVLCPRGAVPDWVLEEGSAMLEPRLCIDALPGPSPISCMSAMLPSSESNSTAFTLLQHSAAFPANHEYSLSSRAFYQYAASTYQPSSSSSSSSTARSQQHTPAKKSLLYLSKDSNNIRVNNSSSSSNGNNSNNPAPTSERGGDTWQLALATGSLSQSQSQGTSEATRPRTQDLVVTGHVDGSILMWGVSQPISGGGGGSGGSNSESTNNTRSMGSIWTPLRTLRCHSSEITGISIDEQDGLIAAVDSEGWIVLWKVHKSGSRLSESPSTGGDGVLRELLRMNIEEPLSCCLAVGSASLCVFGSASGEVFVCTDWIQEKSVLPVLAVARSGGNGGITGLWVGPFWGGDRVEPVVYISWESGHVAAMHLHTREILGFGKGPECSRQGDGSSSTGTPMTGLSFISVLSESRAVLQLDPALLLAENFKHSSSATTQKYTESQQPLAFLQATNPNDLPGVKDIRKLGSNIIGKIHKRKGSDTDSIPVSTEKKSTSGPGVIPVDGPKYLVRALGKALVTFDLSTFSIALPNGKFSNGVSGGFTKQLVSTHDIVAVQCVSYLEESSRAWSDPIPLIQCIDSLGVQRLISISEQQVWVELSVLTGIIGTHTKLKSGVILLNGDSYVQQNASMIYSSYTQSSQYLTSRPKPAAASPAIIPLRINQQLKTNTSGKKEAKVRSKSSMLKISVGTTVVDLDKIFQKSRNQRNKEELLGKPALGTDDSEVEEDEHEPFRQTTTTAASVTNRTQIDTRVVMDETRQAFEERGEIASRVAKKTENFKNAAQEYRDAATAHKNELKQKNARWGLF